MRSGATPLVDGAVVTNHDRIIAVGPSRSLLKSYPQHPVKNLRNAVLMPGLINLHTHLELPPLLNSIRAKAFPDWVLNLIKAKRALRAQDYAAAASRNIECLIESGTTCVGEICTQGVSSRLLKQSRMRALIFHEIIDMDQGKDAQGHARELLLRINKLLSRETACIRMGLSPHAPHTVSPAALLAISKIARRRHLPLCMHVAESRDELQLLQGKKSGFEKLYQAAGWDRSWAPSAMSPFEYLGDLGLLGPGFLAIHAVQATDRDIQLIKSSGTPVAHCPRSNRETGVGRMPLQKMLHAGITVGLGTDSLASSPSLNLWDEMRYAFRAHTADGMDARAIMKLATTGGARALGMADDIGSLSPGKKADLIAVPFPEKSSGDIYYDLLMKTKSCMMSIVNGRTIYEKHVS